MITAAGLVLGLAILWGLVKFLGSKWAERQIFQIRIQDHRCRHGMLSYWAERRCTTCRNQVEMDFNREEYWRRRTQ